VTHVSCLSMRKTSNRGHLIIGANFACVPGQLRALAVESACGRGGAFWRMKKRLRSGQVTVTRDMI
jgi:hypothetical protein